MVKIVMQDRVPDGHTNGKDICAIAVTYHPDAEFPTRIKRILPQVGALLSRIAAMSRPKGASH